MHNKTINTTATCWTPQPFLLPRRAGARQQVTAVNVPNYSQRIQHCEAKNTQLSPTKTFSVTTKRFSSSQKLATSFACLRPVKAILAVLGVAKSNDVKESSKTRHKLSQTFDDRLHYVWCGSSKSVLLRKNVCQLVVHNYQPHFISTPPENVSQITSSIFTSRFAHSPSQHAGASRTSPLPPLPLPSCRTRTPPALAPTFPDAHG